jgi:tRNA(fMet)-specific endonuclease VapC
LAYLIDTNIAIHARDGFEPVLEKLAQHDGAVLLSALSLAELQRGLYRSPELGSLRKARLEALLQAIPVLPFEATAAEIYGQIIARIGWARGRDFDRLIAAHALATGSFLVTANTADFANVPGLTIENWVARS